MFKLHLWDHFGGARSGERGSRSGLIRLGSAKKTGLGIKHRPGVKKVQTGAVVKGGLSDFSSP